MDRGSRKTKEIPNSRILYLVSKRSTPKSSGVRVIPSVEAGRLLEARRNNLPSAWWSSSMIPS